MRRPRAWCRLRVPDRQAIGVGIGIGVAIAIVIATDSDCDGGADSDPDPDAGNAKCAFSTFANIYVRTYNTGYATLKLKVLFNFADNYW